MRFKATITRFFHLSFHIYKFNPFYMKQFFTAFLLLTLFTNAKAQELYRQDFETGFGNMVLINNDGKTPNSALAAFTNAWNIRAGLTGNWAMSISWYAPVGASDDWMITPVITGITAKSVLEWDAIAIDANYPDGYKVMVSVGGAAIADFTDKIFEVANEKPDFTRHGVLLGDYAGQDIRIAFVNTSYDLYALAVDNIVVRELADVDASLVKVDGESYVLTGEGNYLNYKFKNEGFQPIDTATITWTDGTNIYTEVLTDLNLPFDAEYEGTFSDPFTADSPEKYGLNFSLSVSGGVEDSLTNNYVAKTFYGVSTIVPKRVVAEEGTGTWCGWCPRGAVFMEAMRDIYPDVFIPIAVHNGTGEPMKNVDYDAGITAFPGFPGFPAVVMDRKEVIDPSDLEATIAALKNAITPVAVEVQATIDSLARKMYIQGKVTTYTNRENTKFDLVLVVAENDVRGTAAGYRQTNYYAANANGPMGGYESLANPVPAAQMKYDFVGRKLIYGFKGSAAIIPDDIHVDEEFNFTATYVFPATYDMHQLYVVAMVLDSTSGNVLNAAKSEAVTSSVKAEIKELGSLKIYPNPAQGTAFLDMELTEAATVTMELVNQLGQMVRTQDHGKLPAGHSVLPLRVTGLSAGVYMVKMNIAGQSVLRKLVIE